MYYQAILQRKKWAILVIASFSVTTLCFAVLLPYMLAHAIDLISQGQSLVVGGALLTSLYIAAGAVVLGIVCNALGLWGFVQMDSPAQNHLRSVVFRRLTHESAAFYADAMTGSLTGNVIAYTNGYATVQELIIQRSINLVLPIIVGMGIIAQQSLLLAGVFAAMALVISAKTMLDSRKRAPYRRARKDAGSKLNGFLGDVMSNSATIRIFAGEAFEQRGLDAIQRIWRRSAQANLGMFSKHYVTLVGSINLLQVVGIGLAAWLATTGSISLGLVVFAISYFQRLSNGLVELGPIIQSYQGALMDAAPISEILMRPQELIDTPGARKLRVSKGAIDLNSVTYRYEPGLEPVFTDLSLHIPAGQSVGIVGRSVGGKTTLTNLLLRFADIESGTISIDGQGISKVTQGSLRQAISYVPQDPQLFHRSMRENIAYGLSSTSLKSVIAAAKKAHIWELIQSLPEQLDTKVGERGVKLSGGQRQRVAIARAILKDAPILIFDEATSALDSESERHIQDSIEQLIKGRTSVIIAHRLSTIQKMDRIIVLDKGQIIEDGSHTQLIAQKGVYASLWAHQSGGFIAED